MKLAYAAYMPLTGDFLGLAPGLFMEDNIVSAEDLLDDYGIKSVAFNTDKKDTVCHIIGHKQIYANINYDTSDNTNGGANNATFGVYKNVSGSGMERGFSWDDSSGLRSDDYNNNVFTSSGRYSEAFWKALNSDDANNTDCMIKTNTNTNGGNNNGTLGILEGTGKHGTIGYFSDDFQSGLRTDVSMDSTGMSCVGSSEAFWNTLNSNGANNTDCMIKTNTNTNGGNDNDRYLGVLEGIDRNESIGVYTDNDSSRLRTDDFVGNVYFDSRKNSGAFQNTLNSDNTDCMRILVVVDIRGSSTLKDWFTDIGTEIGLSDFSFKAGMETVLKSLYHGTGETYVLLYRCVHSIILPYTAVEITTPFQT